MSAEALATTPMEDLVARYRGRKLSRTQLLLALTAAGATAVGATAFVNAIDQSQSTPPAAPTVSHSAHQTLAPATSQTAQHERHIELQKAGR